MKKSKVTLAVGLFMMILPLFLPFVLNAGGIGIDLTHTYDYMVAGTLGLSYDVHSTEVIDDDGLHTQYTYYLHTFVETISGDQIVSTTNTPILFKPSHITIDCETITPVSKVSIIFTANRPVSAITVDGMTFTGRRVYSTSMSAGWLAVGLLLWVIGLWILSIEKSP